ncbi:MAG TPA: biopolymer transporter ExbD [Pirellulales bacterium]|nr:biopolymer transporter ExbD [Pirellulales bacterium]
MGRRRPKQTDVELNLAAMLDMAFQLLAFFILTFKPSPVEGQITLHLPPPQPVANLQAEKQAGENTADISPVAGLETLVVSLFSTSSGDMASMAVGEVAIGSQKELDTRLRTILKDPGSPFDQVIIQVDSALRYEELMQVVDVCTRQTLGNGQKLSKLSFVELPHDAKAQN